MKKIINLRLVSGVEVQEILHYVQYSTEIPVEFHFSDYEIPDGASARFYLLKPSGKEIYNECQIDGNTVILQPTAQTFAEYGRQSAQIQIVADDKVLVSYIIRCDVEKNLIAESAIPSTDEFGILDTLVEEARKKIKESADATDAANTATEAANTAASAATAAKEAADAAAENAKTATDEAVKNANEATDAAVQKASEATDAANAAAGEATTAKEAADTAANAANAATESATTAAQAANDAAERVKEMISSGRGLVPEGGEKDQVLTSDETGAAKWTGDLNVKTLKVAGIDMTITEAEYNELMNLLGGGIARICDWLHPVGEVIISADAKFDPNRLYVGQTWERYAKGQTLVGVDEADADFVAGKIGGAKSVSYTPAGKNTDTTLDIDHIPSHRHLPSTAGEYFVCSSSPEAYNGKFATTTSGDRWTDGQINSGMFHHRTGTEYVGGSKAHGHAFTGTKATISTMPPYVTTYFWKRTA